MYETDGTEIQVNGPVSLLKNTKRYGSSLAKLIQILDEHQLTDKVLNLIGYKIVWNGLIPVRITEID